MRILMISDVYFPRINGVSTSIRNFRRELSDLGNEVSLIAPAYGQHEDEPSVFRIPSRYVPVDPEDRMMRSRSISALYPALADRRFDIMHIHTPFVAHYSGVALARKLGVPVVVTFHTHFEEYLYHYVPFIPRSVMRWSARRFNRAQFKDVDAIVVPSHAMRDVLQGYGVDKPVKIIPTGVDRHFFRPGAGGRFRTQHNIPLDRPVVLYVGRLAHEKNIDFLLNMLARLVKLVPDVLLIIAGEGPAKKHLKNRSRSLGLDASTLFVGYLDRNTVLLDCYSAADVFTFSSRTETQGLVLLEAMAQGTPVVSLSVLGTRDILRPGLGALVAPEDEARFADAVASVLRDSALHARLGRQAVEYAKSWSSREFALRKQTLYQETIGCFQ